MSTHIYINGHEVKNPVAKFGIGIGASLFAGLVMGVILFVLLPLLGITLAASFSFVLVVTLAGLAAALALGFGTFIISLLMGSIEFLIGKSGHRK